MSRDLYSSDTWIRQLCAGLAITVALAQLGATAYYLATGGDDWLSVASTIVFGVLAAVMGVALWRGRSGGRPMVLAPVLWRHWFAACLLTFMGTGAALGPVAGIPWLEWLRETPMAVMVMGIWLLFTPMQDWETPVGLDSAQCRTWRRSIVSLALAGAAGVLAAVVLAVLGLEGWTPLPLAAAVILFVLAALMRRAFRLLQRVVDESAA